MERRRISRVTKKETIKDGKRDGPWEKFYENGQLLEMGNYKDGEQHGLWEYFDRDGNLDDIPF